MNIAKLPLPGPIKVILKCAKERGSETEAPGVCATSIKFQQNFQTIPHKGRGRIGKTALSLGCVGGTPT